MLIKKYKPGASRADVLSFLRHREPKQVKGTIVDPASEFADAVLEPSDKKELREFKQHLDDEDVKATAMKQVVREEGTKYLESMGFHGRLPVLERRVPDKVAKQRKLDWTKINSLEEYKRLLPKITGCTIQQPPGRHAYVVFYPGVTPASHQRSWGTYTRAECAHQCVRWAWDHHTRLTGTPWPYRD